MRYSHLSRLLAVTKQNFALGNSNKKPRKCGASWYIITSKLESQFLWG